MRVILLQDVKKVGHRYEVREVSDGYAKNFLIPNGLAKQATDSDLKAQNEFRLQKKQLEEAVQSKLKVLASRISETPLLMKAAAGEKGEIFGSINRDAIFKELKKRYGKAGFPDKCEILMKKPIKAIGEYEIEADLGFGAKAKLKLTVKPELR